MIEPDVYEELGRLAERWEEQSCSEGIGWAGESRFITIEEGSGAANAFDAAQQLVEFLRWREASEEWPADGCRCLIVCELKPFGWATDHAYVLGPHRETVARWRYVLGPCSCAKEG